MAVFKFDSFDANSTGYLYSFNTDNNTSGTTALDQDLFQQQVDQLYWQATGEVMGVPKVKKKSLFYIKHWPGYGCGYTKKFYPHQVIGEIKERWLIMDGEWWSITKYPDLVKNLDKKIIAGNSYPWYRKRGKGFQVIDPMLIEKELY